MTHGDHVQAWKRRNPEKARAHCKVQRALKSGRLAKRPCACCGSRKVTAHHADYARPLRVTWACKKRHRRLDAARRKREAERSLYLGYARAVPVDRYFDTDSTRIRVMIR